jgi:hypothetical protein
VSEKKALERGAVANFIECFVNRFDRGLLEFVDHLPPPHPDTLCDLNGDPIYIEVAHIYGTRADAKLLLGRRGRSKPTAEEQFNSSLIPLDVRTLAPLNRVLAEKANKKYEGTPVWLLIRSGLPLWTEKDFADHREEIVVPINHPFDEIWLLCGPRALFGLIRLF